jgi:hypothetical protein
MIDRTFADVARRAAATVSRRGSLAALGAAALAGGLGGPTPAGAKKKCKKKKKRCPDPPPPPACADVCPETCDPNGDPTPDPIFCFERADGPPLCATGGDPDCTQTCSSDTDCVGTDRPYCVTGYEIMTTGQQSDVCGQPGAHCTSLTACAP